MRKVGIIAHIDHGKTSLTSMIALAITTKQTQVKEIEMANTPNTRTVLQTAANKSGLTEAVGDKIADWLEENNWEVTQAPAGKSELKVQPQAQTDSAKKTK